MSKPTSDKPSGMNFLHGLTLLFIGLKLTENIDWSWFWVVSPMYLQILVVVAQTYGPKK